MPGGGTIRYNQGGQREQVWAGYIHAEDPLHSEALAILNILHQLEQEGQDSQRGQLNIFSDCKVLVQAINNSAIEGLPSWKAANTVVECILLTRQWGEEITITFASRDALKGPHALANWARRTRLQSTALATTQTDIHQEVTLNLNENFFKIDARQINGGGRGRREWYQQTRS